jgi:hypothetical protein
VNVWTLAGGRSLRALSRAAGLSEAQVSRLFSGSRGGTLESLLRLVDAGLPAEPLLRALVHARAQYLQRRAVSRELDRYRRRG